MFSFLSFSVIRSTELILEKRDNSVKKCLNPSCYHCILWVYFQYKGSTGSRISWKHFFTNSKLNNHPLFILLQSSSLIGVIDYWPWLKSQMMSSGSQRYSPHTKALREKQCSSSSPLLVHCYISHQQLYSMKLYAGL